MGLLVIIIIIAIAFGWWRIRRAAQRTKNYLTCANGHCKECVHIREADSRTSPTGYMCILQRGDDWNKITPDDWRDCCQRPKETEQ